MFLRENSKLHDVHVLSVRNHINTTYDTSQPRFSSAYDIDTGDPESRALE